MTYLCLGARNRAEDGSNQRNHHIVDEIGLDVSAGEMHALGKSSIAHFLFAVLNTSPVEILVEEEVDCNLKETKSPKDIADREDPADSVHIFSSLRRPDEKC